jgi:hypothetical protein
MLKTGTMTTAGAFAAAPKETLLNGKMVRRHSVEINGQTFSISTGPLSFAALEEEWFEDLKDPEIAIVGLARCRPRPDIFTFCQRVPEVEPKYEYQSVCDSLAVLPITTFDEWWNKQVKGTTRNMIRKSRKAGVEIREATFDDEFVQGMVEIFNETPIRQGRRFWHYGKDFATVKREFSLFLFREYLIGAYLGDELIGFVMLANAGCFGVLGQFISKVAHRDKATNNALIAKTVEVCEQRQLRYLLYTDWKDSSLVAFKRYSGFEEMKLPRYFVPLTLAGRTAMRLGLERFRGGIKEGIPDSVRKPLKMARKRWDDLWSAKQVRS